LKVHRAVAQTRLRPYGLRRGIHRFLFSGLTAGFARRRINCRRRHKEAINGPRFAIASTLTTKCYAFFLTNSAFWLARFSENRPYVHG
jgi:hypothetical protein